MAKQTSSSPSKRKTPASFSEIEMDVAFQLMQLCRKYNDGINGDRGLSKKTKEDDESNPLEEEEEEEQFQPRKKRFKSIDFIYRTTKPLIIQNHLLVEKMKMMCN